MSEARTTALSGLWTWLLLPRCTPSKVQLVYTSSKVQLVYTGSKVQLVYTSSKVQLVYTSSKVQLDLHEPKPGRPQPTK